MISSRDIGSIQANAPTVREHEEAMSNSSRNIDCFNAVAAHLFSVLYDSFPNAIHVETADVARGAAGDLEPDQLREWERIAASTVSWLAEEEFLHVHSAVYGGFMNVRLSMKGLTVLGYIPVSIKPDEPPEPLIVRLKRFAGKGIEGATTDAVKHVLGQIFKLGLGYVTSAGTSS